MVSKYYKKSNSVQCMQHIYIQLNLDKLSDLLRYFIELNLCYSHIKIFYTFYAKEYRVYLIIY